MAKIDCFIPMIDVLNALGLDAVPDGCVHKVSSQIEIGVNVPQDEIDEHATEQDPELVPVDHSDLRDGLRAVVSGDLSMGRLLLLRAFDAGDSDMLRVIEEALR